MEYGAPVPEHHVSLRGKTTVAYWVGKQLSGGRDRTTATDPEIGDRQSFPKSRIDHVDQVLSVGGDEGAVVRRQTHGLGLLVTHAVGHVQPHHVARVGLVQRHQVELHSQSKRNTSVTTVETCVDIVLCVRIQQRSLTR